MNALAIHLYLTIRYINLSFNYFCNFYRIIVYEAPSRVAKKRISEEITSLIDQYSSDSKKLSELETLVNRHHNNILIKLRNEFPDLKDPDFRLFMFSVLGFSNSAIAIFLGEAKITAIYDRRKRLKAKFRLSASPNKEIYLKAIS